MSEPINPRALARSARTRALRAALEGAGESRAVRCRRFTGRFSAQGKAPGKLFSAAWVAAGKASGKMQSFTVAACANGKPLSKTL